MYINPDPSSWGELTSRRSADDHDIAQRVAAIIERVRGEGDAALRDFARTFDHTELTGLALTEDEYSTGAGRVSPEVAQAIDRAYDNIRAFHRAQLPDPVEVVTAPGVRCRQRAVPIRRVGLYIPGGSAPLFSTVLMLALPAAIARCSEVVLCTPQRADGHIAAEILYAARRCGVHTVYRVGGAQAIAAMAYGTESIPAVDKIFGPGNRYVTLAKQAVSAHVAIDMPAGPSEVMVLADETAVPAFVAADLLSQAEHGPDSQAILVASSVELAEQVEQEVSRQKLTLPRHEQIEHSLARSRTIVLDTRDRMIDFANAYAAEHLILALRDPWQAADKIVAAGSIFVGNYSPESAGDYASGTNHTLPTSGWARAYSGVNIDSFMRKITYQELTPDGLRRLSPTILTMARAEGLDAHANAVRVRLGGRQA